MPEGTQLRPLHGEALGVVRTGGKVQPRLKYVAWFSKSKCTKCGQNVQTMVKQIPKNVKT